MAPKKQVREEKTQETGIPAEKPKRNWRVFYCAVFFVLGFSVIFSLLGALLQSVLSEASYTIQNVLAKIGGAIIIVFGIYLLGLIKIPFLEQEHKFHVKRKFNSAYATAFVFGAAFAVGWTPCVGPVLGAVLTLAATQPSIAFFLMMSYTLGMGIPFLIVGLFVNQAQAFLDKAATWIKYVNYFFGLLLIVIGVLVFTENLNKVANFSAASDVLIALNLESIGMGPSLNFGIAFLAGLVSFLSPCVLPLIPGFLSYLAAIATKKE
jgi:cytochrome c-type biogenesis protein